MCVYLCACKKSTAELRLAVFQAKINAAVSSDRVSLCVYMYVYVRRARHSYGYILTYLHTGKGTARHRRGGGSKGAAYIHTYIHTYLHTYMYIYRKRSGYVLKRRRKQGSWLHLKLLLKRRARESNKGLRREQEWYVFV